MTLESQNVPYQDIDPKFVEAIKLEIENGHGPVRYFQNFYLRLPDGQGFIEDGLFSSISSRQSQKINFLDIKPEAKEYPLESPLRAGQTNREFFQTITAVIKSLNLQKAFDECKDPGKRNELAEPVYIRLRSMGYNHLDLIR